MTNLALVLTAQGKLDTAAAIYRESHAVWGAGLTPENYSGLWDEISRTPWAQRFARFLVWADEPQQVLSSLKLYRPLVRVLGRTARTTVLSAIFTSRALNQSNVSSVPLIDSTPRASKYSIRIR